MSDTASEAALGQTVVTTVRRSAKKAKAKKSKPNGAASTKRTADPNYRTISITLPTDVLAWYEEKAGQAPFEPSVQKYVAWQLRQLAAQERQILGDAQNQAQRPKEAASAEEIPRHI